jgi:hypothetical protein
VLKLTTFCLLRIDGGFLQDFLEDTATLTRRTILLVKKCVQDFAKIFSPADLEMNPVSRTVPLTIDASGKAGFVIPHSDYGLIDTKSMRLVMTFPEGQEPPIKQPEADSWSWYNGHTLIRNNFPADFIGPPVELFIKHEPPVPDNRLTEKRLYSMIEEELKQEQVAIANKIAKLSKENALRLKLIVLKKHRSKKF